MAKYKGLYRNESPRLRGWDYSKSGYSITPAFQPQRGAIILENSTTHAIQPQRGDNLIEIITDTETQPHRGDILIAPVGRHPNRTIK
jgi:hypothetical protein